MGVQRDRKYARLRAENEALRFENAELRRHLHDALRLIESLREEIADLRAQLNANSTNSSRPPSSDGPQVRRPIRPPSLCKQGGQPGHVGHQRLLFPPEQVQRVVACKPTRCSHCEHRLSGTDPDPLRRQVVDLPPISPVVTEYQLHELECAECGRKTRAEVPPEATRLLGPRATAKTALLAGQFRLSIRLVRDIFEGFFNLRLSTGTISRSEQVASEAVAQPVEELREHIQAQPVLYVDPTGWREQKKRQYLWVATTESAAAFSIKNTRAKSVVRDVVGADSSRWLVTDRAREFEWYPTEHRQVCWAHLQRNFKGWTEREGVAHSIGEKLLQLTRQLFHEWHRFKRGGLTRNGLQRKMKPIRDEVEAQLQAAWMTPGSAVAGSAATILKVKEALWPFVTVEGVEPTNNLSERTLRPGVIWRKLCFGTKSERGGQFVERILTVRETLRRQGRNALTYLTDAIEAYIHARSPPSLVPVHS